MTDRRTTDSSDHFGAPPTVFSDHRVSTSGSIWSFRRLSELRSSEISCHRSAGKKHLQPGRLRTVHVSYNKTLHRISSVHFPFNGPHNPIHVPPINPKRTRMPPPHLPTSMCVCNHMFGVVV
ncbi:hypothetical protein MRB53_034571 [Persea americana]|uniref:Uncharacterized protein n=1 Tax=Persea americana TaxID=3435 RepID=A0ACC2K290_PERAE|nr:hypothetical protein MRB53_034571 [Persea americana]